jgi:hypothetical protein
MLADRIDLTVSQNFVKKVGGEAYVRWLYLPIPVPFSFIVFTSNKLTQTIFWAFQTSMKLGEFVGYRSKVVVPHVFIIQQQGSKS